MLWRISYELELFQEMSTKILASGLGKYLLNPYSYLAITKRSIYVDNHTHENQESKRLTVVLGKAKYISSPVHCEDSRMVPAHQGCASGHDG